MKSGEGTGESAVSEKVGNFTSKSKCINVCKEKEKINSKINGAMIGIGAEEGCWCVSSMTGRGNNSDFESCIMCKYNLTIGSLPTSLFQLNSFPSKSKQGIKAELRNRKQGKGEEGTLASKYKARRNRGQRCA